MNLLFIILLVITLCISLRIITRNANGEVQLFSFNVQRTLPLRGILAFLIITHHLSQAVWYQKIPIIQEFMSWGGVVVGVFFFITGYGLMISYIQKGDNYLTNFLSHRLRKTLPPLFYVTICYLIIKSFITQSNAFLSVIDLKNGTTPLPSSWFVYTVILFYFAFYLLARILPNKKILIISLWCISTLYIIELHSWGWEDCWYKSTYALNIGFTYAFYEAQIKQHFKSHPYSIILLLITIMIILSTIRYLNTTIFITSTPFWKSTVYYSVPLFCIVVIYLFRGLYSSFLCFLGKISYEIYLVQGAYVTLFSPIKESWISYFLIVYILSFLSAWLLNKSYNIY